MPRKRGRARKTTRRPRTDPAARERALEAVNYVRSDGCSLTEAARRARTTPATVRKYASPALVRSPGGRYAATPSDRLTRHIRFLTKDGIAAIRVRGSKAASDTARHWAAAKHCLLTGETEALAEFHGRSIRADGVTYYFITDPATLERLHAAGETSFERLYTQRG